MPTQIEQLETYQLAAIGHRTSRSVSELFSEDFGLQVPDWRILVILSGVDFLSFKEVVERTGMDKSRVSRAHVRLQKAGLVLVSKGPFDNRTLVMKLSTKGENVCKLLIPKIEERNQWLLNALSTEEQASFATILEKLSLRVKVLDKPYQTFVK